MKTDKQTDDCGALIRFLKDAGMDDEDIELLRKTLRASLQCPGDKSAIKNVPAPEVGAIRHR